MVMSRSSFPSGLNTRDRADLSAFPMSPLRAIGRWSAGTPAVVRPLYRSGQYPRKGLGVSRIDALTARV